MGSQHIDIFIYLYMSLLSLLCIHTNLTVKMTLKEHKVFLYFDCMSGGTSKREPHRSGQRLECVMMIFAMNILFGFSADVYDVVESLRFARDHSLKAAANAAGHGDVGVSLLPNEVVIDTKNLTADAVDPDSETAYVEACGLIA